MKHKFACAMRVQWPVQKLCFTDSGMRSDDGTAKWNKVVSFQTLHEVLFQPPACIPKLLLQFLRTCTHTLCNSRRCFTPPWSTPSAPWVLLPIFCSFICPLCCKRVWVSSKSISAWECDLKHSVAAECAKLSLLNGMQMQQYSAGKIFC